MAKAKSGKARAVSIADLRGVETFDTNDTVLLARAAVEEVAAAIAAQKQLKIWHREALGKVITLPQSATPDNGPST